MRHTIIGCHHYLVCKRKYSIIEILNKFNSNLLFINLAEMKFDRIVMCPTIDKIDSETYEYMRQKHHNS